MKTLQQAIDKLKNKGGVGQSLQKYLSAVEITSWEDITRTRLYDFREQFSESGKAPGTARTNCANLKALLNRYKDEIELPADWEKILSVKATAPMKTYLTEQDLRKLEGAPIHTMRQRYVKNVFLICAYTGLRVSDAMNLRPENIVDGYIHYTAQKTKKAGCVPLKPGLEERIGWVAEHQDYRVTLAAYDKAVKKMAKDAGIDDIVVVFKAGREQRGPKWQFISSHSARVSLASNLNKRGAPVGDITLILQHSGSAMTERYIVRDRIDLSPQAMRFFN